MEQSYITKAGKNTRAIAHAFSSKMEDLGLKEIIDLNTPSCSSIKELLNAQFNCEFDNLYSSYGQGSHYNLVSVICVQCTCVGYLFSSLVISTVEGAVGHPLVTVLTRFTSAPNKLQWEKHCKINT